MTGVNERERERQQHWADLGLPDPIRVLGAERQTKTAYGATVKKSAERAVLDKYFQTHPDEKPKGW